MVRFPKKLLDKLAEREDENALRKLPIHNNLVDFSSNDYLGIAKNEKIFHNAITILKARDLLLNGATGSRLLTGNHSLYDVLEKKLCDFHGAESALVFNSGYDANIGFFSSVPQRGDVVYYDEFIHASIRDGIKLGNAKSFKFKHNDLEDLKAVIERSVQAQSRTPDANVYIATESVFSMDGDSPNLEVIAELCKANSYRLIVDEAHAVGVCGERGQGLVQELNLQKEVFAAIVTFGKAMGCHGAAILGSDKLKSYLINYARSFIYTTGLSPHSVATIIAAFDFLGSPQGTEVLNRLIQNIECFNKVLKNSNLKPIFTQSNSAIHCCKIQGNDKVKLVAKTLQENGFNVKPILSPTVPIGEERLRFCLHTDNSEKQIEDVLHLLQSII